MVQNVMDSFSDVANISFTETSQLDNANIRWAVLNDVDSGADDTLGYSYLPLPSNGASAGLTTVNWEIYEKVGSQAINPGSFYHLTFLHELGHSLGLEHPHESNDYYGVFPGVSGSQDSGDNQLNGSPWTVMTYNDLDPNIGYSPNSQELSGFLTGLGAFDIAAIQYLYGANKTTNSGDNIYELTSSLNGYKCIWDTGGNDTIDASNALGAASIDLRNATLNNENGGGGYVSSINNEKKGYTIAFGSNSNDISCVIENAKGSSFDDLITGNSSANKIEGGAGNDTLIGGSGNDSLSGDDGNDTVNFIGNIADYSFNLNSITGTIQVADKRLERDGIDTASKIEVFHFNGQNYGLKDVLTQTSFSYLNYVASHSDLIFAFNTNPSLAFEHYINFGQSEGRSPDNFDELKYLASYGDLITTFGSDTTAATQHYISNGYKEGRTLDNFDEWQYLASYGDLITTFGSDTISATQHYVSNGYGEGRSKDSFNEWQYLASHEDLITTFGSDITAATQHYISNGYKEGRSLDSFDEWGYLASNNDLMKAFGSDTTEAIKHYISFGMKEGRVTNSFNVDSYLNNYADINSVFGHDHDLAKKHFIEHGFAEGRVF